MKKWKFAALFTAMVLVLAPVNAVLADGTGSTTTTTTTTTTDTGGTTNTGGGTTDNGGGTTNTGGGTTDNGGGTTDNGGGTTDNGGGTTDNGGGTTDNGGGTTDNGGTCGPTDNGGGTTDNGGGTTDNGGGTTDNGGGTTDNGGGTTDNGGGTTDTGGGTTTNGGTSTNGSLVIHLEDHGHGHGPWSWGHGDDQQGDHGKQGDDEDHHGDQNTGCHSDNGKHKGWTNKIQNMLKHLADLQKALSKLSDQLDKLMAWAKQNGSTTDTQALQDIQSALTAKDGSGEASSSDLSVLAQTQDKLGNVPGSITTLEKAVSLDSSNKALYSELSKQFAKKGDKSIKIYVKGKKPAFDVTPSFIKGRTMVPLRAIGDALNADVKWDAKTNMITLTGKNGTVVKMKPDSQLATVNNKQVKLDSPATVRNNRTLVPLRALGDFFGLNVDWDQTTQMAVLN